ncbi:WD40/YVTN repeat-like containing protein [Gracilaria domingensis]|nr:WD40/YVTN repeat-like containing protein [Gracilaria domingensis]
MRIVAHNGPNWTRDSLATSPEHVAIAVRNTVLIYSHDTTFQTELRAMGGSSRITSISFCNALCLRSLLAVASQGGHVRIFDVEARRIFRVLVEGGAACFAVRFLEKLPFRVLVVSDSLYVFDIVKEVRVIVRRDLPFKHVFLVELIPNLSAYVILAGKRNNGACLSVMNLYDENDNHVIVTGFAVHDVAIRHRPHHVHPYVMAVASAKLSYPMFFTSQNGIQWIKLPDVKPYIPQQIRTMDSYDKQKKLLCSKLLRTAVCWDVDQILYTTDTRGTLYAWEIDDACQMRYFAQRHYAHSRQIFAIKSVENEVIFSISMDRTLAKWCISHVAQPSLTLQWRTMRTQGPVTALASSSRKHGTDEGYISYTTASNSVACVKWIPGEHFFSLVAEACPSNPELGKRKRETISYVTTPDQLFDQSFSSVEEQSQTLFVFGFSDGKRGTFSITDGKVNVSELQRDHSTTLRRIYGGSSNRENNKKNESTNKNFVPSAFDERGKRGEVDLGTSVSVAALGNVLEDDKVTSACLLPKRCRCDEECMDFLLGSAKGCLYFLSKGTETTLLSQSLSASSILCVEYQPNFSLIAISDSGGMLTTLKWSNTELQNQANGKESQAKAKAINRYELPSAVRFMRWSESVSTKYSSGSVSSYLLVALQSGETLLWSSDTEGTLNRRAQLREHRGRVNGGVWFESSYILTAGEDGTIRCWEVDQLPQSK